MNNIINKIPNSSNINILWTYDENKNIYNKFVQFNYTNEEVSKEVSKETSKEVSEGVSEEVSEEVSEGVSKEVSKEVSEEVSKEVSEEVSEGVSEEVSKEVSEEVSEGVSEEVSEEVSEGVSKEVSKEVSEGVSNVILTDIKQSTNKKEKIVKEKIVKEKKDTVLPFDVIIDHCCSSIVAKDYIKQKLIEIISRKDYIKVFGLKKSSEIMDGITKEKWNKSLVIFVSFLLDKEIIYNGKSVLYNIEKKFGTIIIS